MFKVKFFPDFLSIHLTVLELIWDDWWTWYMACEDCCIYTFFAFTGEQGKCSAAVSMPILIVYLNNNLKGDDCVRAVTGIWPIGMIDAFG